MVTACVGGADTTSTSSTTSPPTTSTTVASTTSTPATPTTTVAAITTTTQPIDISFDGGVVVGPGRFSFTVGDQVSVWVLTDIDDEIHVHGYDQLFDAVAGVPIEISLIANVPGIFEVELESTHTLLFELEVTP